MDIIRILSWIAILFLASSYWFQIWKIHVHKEVRDLSLMYHVFLGLGFGILIITAVVEESLIFFVKQVATFVPVVIIIAQILYHKEDRWHDDKGPYCPECDNELEPGWLYCTRCGNKVG